MKKIVSQSASALSVSQLFLGTPSLVARVSKKVRRWYKLTWFLGRPSDLTAHQWKVLGLFAANLTGWDMINESERGKLDQRSPRTTEPQYQTEADRLAAETRS